MVANTFNSNTVSSRKAKAIERLSLKGLREKEKQTKKGVGRQTDRDRSGRRAPWLHQALPFESFSSSADLMLFLVLSFGGFVETTSCLLLIKLEPSKAYLLKCFS